MNIKKISPVFPILLITIVSLSLLSGCATNDKKVSTPGIGKIIPKPRMVNLGINVPVTNLPSIPESIKQYAGDRQWKYVVIHHSASYTGNAATFDKLHRETRGWVNGLGYDFVIGNGNGSGNGQIEVGPRWKLQIDGAHAGVKEYNHFGIGICLVGNFENEKPTRNQISSLLSLIKYFQNRYNIPSENVILHRHVKTTACPGGNFPYFEVLSGIYTR